MLHTGIKAKTINLIISNIESLEIDYNKGIIISHEEQYSNDGYRFIKFHGKEIRSHIVILTTWLFLYDEEHTLIGKVINHKNSIRDDNRLDNLECVTHKENSLHASMNGRLPSKLDPDKVREIRRRLEKGDRPTHIAKDYGVSTTAIYGIKKGKTWTWVI